MKVTVSSGPVVPYTTRNRKKLLTLEILETVTGIILRYGDPEPLDEETKICCKWIDNEVKIYCKRIDSGIKKLRHILFKRDQPVLKEKYWFKYDALCAKSRKLLLTTADHSSTGFFDICELLNAALALADTEWDSVKEALRRSKSKTLVLAAREWKWINSYLAAVYRNLDPNAEDNARIKLGAALAMKFDYLAGGRDHKVKI